MKKITILFVCALAFAGIARGQVIEDFEHIRLNLMLGGAEDDSEMRVVANPDPGEVNASTHVVRFHRSQFGVSWAGFWSALSEPLDLSEYKYVYVDVWKPRISPVKFKIEGGNSADLEIESMDPQTLVEEWETLVFDFSEKDGTWEVIAFLPDFADPVDLEEDIVIYFDNIRVGGPPEEDPGTSGHMVENFEHIVLNPMLGGEDDNSSMEVVPNPDPDDVNPGVHVVEFHRSMHGVPWGGFWSALPEPLDLSEYKYVYVDVWKPRISPVKFKVEGGNSANLEIESMVPQTKVEEWETLVFDFSEKDGTWNVVAFMPDFADPVDLEEDIVIYFDNIRLGNAPDEDPDFEEVDFVWVDFETSGFTNVEGFRDPSAGTTAEDVAGLGVDGGTVVKLDYAVSEGTTVTGYRMWAFPTADVSAYDQLVIHIRAEEAVSNARITLRDHNAVEGGLGTSFAYIDIGAEWQQFILPIDEFELAEGEEHPDLSILQLVLLSFEYDVVDPAEGTVYIDLVGFIGEESTVSVPDTPLGQALDFELYPNPAMETVTVQAAEGSRVRVLDMQGNLVSQWDANGEAHRLDVAHLARGIYIIQVVNNQSIAARKLILQ
jgi:hypothetical protein